MKATGKRASTTVAKPVDAGGNEWDEF